MGESKNRKQPLNRFEIGSQGGCEASLIRALKARRVVRNRARFRNYRAVADRHRTSQTKPTVYAQVFGPSSRCALYENERGDSKTLGRKAMGSILPPGIIHNS